GVSITISLGGGGGGGGVPAPGPLAVPPVEFPPDEEPPRPPYERALVVVREVRGVDRDGGGVAGPDVRAERDQDVLCRSPVVRLW
ncbi:hypothetical protein THAOC_17471, partial [Thalassiosira oceanica]